MTADALATWRSAGPHPVRWILKEFDGLPDWARQSDVALADPPVRTTDAATHIAAVRQGLGMSALPCFVGDVEPSLVRVPGTRAHLYGTLWLLTQGETRRTMRVQLFTKFIAERIALHADLLAGRCARGG